MPVQNTLNCLLAGALVVCATLVPVAAQSDSSSANAASASSIPIKSAPGYDQPPQYILDVMHAPSPPSPDVSPTQDAILLVSEQEYPSISRVATPFLRLAGVRVEPKNHSKHDTPGGYGVTPCASGFAQSGPRKVLSIAIGGRESAPNAAARAAATASTSTS